MAQLSPLWRQGHLFAWFFFFNLLTRLTDWSLFMAICWRHLVRLSRRWTPGRVFLWYQLAWQPARDSTASVGFERWRPGCKSIWAPTCKILFLKKKVQSMFSSGSWLKPVYGKVVPVIFCFGFFLGKKRFNNSRKQGSQYGQQNY